MDPAITIRPARRADVAAVQRCVAGAYEPYVDRIGREPAPLLDDYAELVDRGVVHVAIGGDDELAGVVVAWPEADHLYVDNLATTTAARGTGVGRALLHWVEDQARALGFDEVRLYTNVAMTENLDYYARRGFTETHRSDDSGFARVYFTKRL